MDRPAKWKVRGLSGRLAGRRTETLAPDALLLLSRGSWSLSSSAFDEWRALEYRILTPRSNETWPR